MRRGTWAIIKSFFNFRKGAGAKASAGAFVSCIVFILVLLCVFASFILWFFPYYLWSDEVYDIIIVNAPDSFIEYDEENPWYSEFIYKDHDAAYDFVTYYDWMNKKDAFLTVVFPEDFDEMVEEHFDGSGDDPIELLTYYETNSLEYGGMKDKFISEYLEEYQEYLRQEHGVTQVTTSDMRIADDPIPDPREDYTLASAFFSFGKTVIPLIIFIAILFSAMSTGTNVIAGQKENGTFTEILMSPLPRMSIILGNTAGVTLKSLIPALLVVLMTQTSWYFWSNGMYAVVIYVISLALLISSLVILISVMSDTVISAQTTFLPVFLILVGICVTCIQNYRDVSEVFWYFPIYGHFYGIGIALANETSIPALISCTLSSVLLSAGVTFISSKLLLKERFTVAVESVSSKELELDGMSHKMTFMERADRITSDISFYADQVLYPLAVLSIFQLIAIIPTVADFMSRPEYTQYIMDLRYVVTIEDIVQKTFEVFGLFLREPLFIGLMIPGYVLTIITYIIRVYRRERTGSVKEALSRIGLPLNKPKSVIFSYLTGLIAGFAMMGSVYIILLATGQIEFGGIGLTSITGAFIINLILWLPQGMTEEIMFRGFMMTRIKEKHGTIPAVIISSLLFSAFHSLNVGFTPLAAVNLFLIAMLFALIYLKTGNIWFTSAVHTMWNLTQGNILGLQVSGTEAVSAVLKTTYLKGCEAFITGGDFGPEGGLAVTAVTVVCLILVLLLSFLRRKHPTQKHETESA